MYGMDVMYEQRVRLYSCVCVCVWLNLKVLLVIDAVSGRNLTCMRHFPLRIHYNNGGNDFRFLFVECMEPVSCWRWTSSGYVCITACAIEFKDVISLR